MEPSASEEAAPETDTVKGISPKSSPTMVTAAVGAVCTRIGDGELTVDEATESRSTTRRVGLYDPVEL